MQVNKKRSIGLASQETGIQEHVIRFWETQFPEYIKPTIGNGNRRYYYDEDIEILMTIKDYLHRQGYTIKGLKNLMKTKNIFVKATSQNIATKDVPDVKILRETVYMKPSIASNELKSKFDSFKDKLYLFYTKLQNI